MMRVLILGGSGFVGSNLVRYYSRKYSVCFTYYTTPRPESRNLPAAMRLDIRDESAVEQLLFEMEPAVVINAAGIKDVRACEAHPDMAMAVNGEGARNVARACQRTGAWCVYLSTDLVFRCDDGPYCETDTPLPSTAYGQSKLSGEEMTQREALESTVCRSGGLYGRSSPLLSWLAAELGAGHRVDAFTDVVNTPTYCINLAEMIEAAVLRRLSGVFHMSGPDRVSRYNLFQVFARTFDCDLTGLVSTVAGDRRRELLLQADASLSSDVSARKLGVHRDGIEAGMTRLKSEGAPK